MSPRTLVERIVDFRPDNGQRLWPWLVGPTGVGKTTLVRQLGADRSIPVSTVLLQTMLPEEILGIPRVSRGVTEWALPDWARPHLAGPGIVFLDEIDKARPEAISTVLTLLAENRIRDTRLHPDTIMIAAGQPIDAWSAGDETYRALRARLVPVPMPPAWSYLSGLYGVDLSGFPAGSPTIPPALESPSPRQVQWCIELLMHHYDDVSKHLVALCLGDDWSRRLMSDIVVSPERIAKGLVRRPDDVDRLPMSVLIQSMPYVLIHGTPELLANVLCRVISFTSPDEGERALKHFYDTLYPIAAAAGNDGVPVFLAAPQATPEDWERALDRAVRRIAINWGAKLPQHLVKDL